MRIARRGHAADHGWEERNVTLSRVTWSSSREELSFHSEDRITQFFGPGNHIVTNSLTVDEFVRALKHLAKKADDVGEQLLADKLKSALPAMIKLQNIVASAA